MLSRGPSSGGALPRTQSLFGSWLFHSVYKVPLKRAEHPGHQSKYGSFQLRPTEQKLRETSKGKNSAESTRQIQPVKSESKKNFGEILAAVEKSPEQPPTLVPRGSKLALQSPC